MKQVLNPDYQNGRRAYVLGAKMDSGNIGEAVALKLMNAGYVVTADDGAVSNHPIGLPTRAPGQNIDPASAERYGYEPTGQGGYVHYSAPAVSDFATADADVLVITMGKTYKTHFAETPSSQIHNILRANLEIPLEAASRFVQAAQNAKQAIERRHIIFIGSYAHTHPFTNGTLYCAAKAGLNMAARALGWELTEMGFRINIVHPYHVPGTPMWEEVERGVMESKGWTKEEADEYAHRDLKMPDALTPEEIAQVIQTLVEVPALGWTSGSPIELYGGTR